MINFVKMISLIILMSTFNCFAESGQSIIGKVKENFEKLKTYSLTFNQVQYLEFTGDSTIAEGKIFYKKEDTFRIEQDKNYIISDGKTVYRYSSQTNQVLIENIKEDKNMFHPGKLFYDFAENYELSDYLEKGDNYLLKMKAPLEDEKFIHALDVYVDEDYYVYRVDYYDLDDNRTKILFLDRQKNPKLPNETFTFKAKEGVDIQDLR